MREGRIFFFFVHFSYEFFFSRRYDDGRRRKSARLLCADFIETSCVSTFLLIVTAENIQLTFTLEGEGRGKGRESKYEDALANLSIEMEQS